MGKTNQKTIETGQTVSSFVDTVEDAQRRQDCQSLIDLMEEVSGCKAKMWGAGIIGFGYYHYQYDSGREGDAPLVGFSPRKTEFALYIANFEGKNDLLRNFGKHKAGKGCVYVKRLVDIETNILKLLVSGSVSHYREKYPL
jgi:hypothetical protein